MHEYIFTHSRSKNCPPHIPKACPPHKTRMCVTSRLCGARSGLPQKCTFKANPAISQSIRIEIEEFFSQVMLLAALPHRRYAQNDNTIMFCFPIHFQFTSTSEGGFTESAFNSNWLNANSVWIQLM